MDTKLVGAAQIEKLVSIIAKDGEDSVFFAVVTTAPEKAGAAGAYFMSVEPLAIERY